MDGYDGVYAYFRHHESAMVIVVLNPNNSSTRLNTDRFAELLKGKFTANEVISRIKVYDLTKIVLQPRSISIFEIE